MGAAASAQAAPPESQQPTQQQQQQHGGAVHPWDVPLPAGGSGSWGGTGGRLLVRRVAGFKVGCIGYVQLCKPRT